MRYKARKKDHYLIVKAKASFGEQVDEGTLYRFQSLRLRGFLNPVMIKKKVVEYQGPVGITLQERLKSSITKRDFLRIMEYTVVAVQKIQLNKLSLDRVLLNPQYVYINDVTKEMQFLYIPSDKPIQTLGVTGFFDAIIYAAIPSHEDDMEYVARTNDRIKSMKEFSAEKLELFIQKEDREIVNIIRKQHSGQSGVMDTARTIHNRPGQDP